MQTYKILNIRSQDKTRQSLLAKELKISNILAQLLLNRGISSFREADNFLRVKAEQFLDPFIFRDMKKAVAILKKAAVDKNTVLIAGDYDVDGVSSVALLKNTLKKLNLETVHYIPHRVKDGYGLNGKAVSLAKEKGAKIVVTADCGITSINEIRALMQNNITCIVTDHHEPSAGVLPEASVLINPKIEGCPYKFKDLAGVGVAYKLCQALSRELLIDELDLVSLGTIADVVPLLGENRIIVKEGLSKISQAKRKGIKALIESSRINGREMNSTFVSYILGPRINASGRMDTAETALNLLLSENEEEAGNLAKTIETLNRQRQKIESEILQEAEDLINSEVNFKEHKVIVVAKEGWHRGVLGVVASKLADKFYRPTIIISLGQDLCKGSGRSIKNFHLLHALKACSRHLDSFGGHSHAAGLSVAKENIDNFKAEINRFAAGILTVEDLFPVIDIDMELGLQDLSEGLAQDVIRLEPFGCGNSEPVFLTRNLRLKGEPQVLARETLKFWVSDGDITYPAIGFGMARLKESLVNSDGLDLAYSLKIDNWAGGGSFILQAEELFFKL